MLFVDLDGFKGINDSLGHHRGDELLIAVASRLTHALRAPDTAARIGGDEFAVLVDDLHDEREAVIVANRMLEALREPITLAGQELTVRASIGVATARGPGGDLLRDADVAMYQAKNQGRDRVVSFDADMHAAMIAGVALENDLRCALRERRVLARLPADRRPRDRPRRAPPRRCCAGSTRRWSSSRWPRRPG